MEKVKEAKKKQANKVNVDDFINRKLSVLNAKGDSKKAQTAMARVIAANRGKA